MLSVVGTVRTRPARVNRTCTVPLTLQSSASRLPRRTDRVPTWHAGGTTSTASANAATGSMIERWYPHSSTSRTPRRTENGSDGADQSSPPAGTSGAISVSPFMTKPELLVDALSPGRLIARCSCAP